MAGEGQLDEAERQLVVVEERLDALVVDDGRLDEEADDVIVRVTPALDHLVAQHRPHGLDVDPHRLEVHPPHGVGDQVGLDVDGLAVLDGDADELADDVEREADGEVLDDVDAAVDQALVEELAGPARMNGSRSPMRRGVNTRLTILRCQLWKGGSLEMRYGAPASVPSIVTPMADENVSGSRWAASTSS